MEKIKSKEITFTVKVKVGCNNDTSEDYTQKEFDSNDLKAIAPYLEQIIERALDGQWQYAAEVHQVSIKHKINFD